MKKAGFILLALVLLGLVLAPSAAFAQISSYNADFQIVNLSDSEAATIAIQFIDQTGATVTTVNDTIAAGGSNTYSPLPASVPAGFDGSVVVSSNVQVAAISNVKGNNLEYGSSYSSFSGGSNTVSLPLINKAFFGINTWYNVQNTGSAATTVNVTYSGTACTDSATIQPGAAVTFDQASNACLPNAYNGAATITAGASGEVVAVVMQVFGGGLLAYNGFAAGGTDVVMPLVTNNVFGILTGIQIQNQGATSTDVTVTYTANSGTGTNCTESATIPAGGAETFSINVFGSGTGNTTSDCVEDEYWIGSAAVTANSAGNPLVAIVNQTNFASGGSSSYSAFNPSAATGTVVMPLLMNAFNIWTGWSVMNVGASDTVTCTYGGTTISVDFTLGTNEAADVQNINGQTGDPNQTLPNAYIGSGTCTAAGGGALLGVVNQANQNAGVTDGTLTYESVNN
jgi:hypothetical protein